MTHESAIFWAVIAWMLCRIIGLAAAVIETHRIDLSLKLVAMVGCLVAIVWDGSTGRFRTAW